MILFVITQDYEDYKTCYLSTACAFTMYGCCPDGKTTAPHRGNRGCPRKYISCEEILAVLELCLNKEANHFKIVHISNRKMEKG